MKSLEMEIDVNESYIARVHEGQRVDAFLDAYPDKPLHGFVRTVIPTADRQKATVKVRITFDKIEDFILPDMGIKVSFLEDAPKEKLGAAKPLATLTQDALRDDGSQKIVYLLKDDHAERRAVTVGKTHGTDVEILAGLNPGDIVIVKPPATLKDGQAVEVRK
jgi:multidrug efflux pump subunit AcrA (membrane-fusion protein)